MTLLIQRRPATDDAILGELFVDGVHECFTLEREGVEIPAGRYRVSITPSAHFGRVLPLINGVPRRTGIRIHSGNYPMDSEGCILVGLSIAHDSVAASRLAMDALQPKIAAALAHNQDVWLTVENPPA